MNYNKAALEKMLATMPGMITIVIQKPDGHPLVLLSSALFRKLLGYSQSELSKIEKTDPLLLIAPSDRQLVHLTMVRLLSSKGSDELPFRLLTKKGDYVWTSVKIKYIGKMRGMKLLLLDHQIDFEQFNAFSSIADAVDKAIYVVDLETNELLFCNKKMLSFLNKDCYVGRKCFEVIQERNTKCDKCPLRNGDQKRVCVRHFYDEFNEKYVDFDSNYLEIHGRKICVVFLTDVTEDTSSVMPDENDQNALNNLMNYIPGGIAVASYKDHKLRVLALNDNLVQMIGSSQDELLHQTNYQISAFIPPEDLSRSMNDMKAVLRGHQAASVYRHLNFKTHKYIWMKAEAQGLQQKDGSVLIYATFEDITKEKEVENCLQESRQRYDAAINGGNFNVWEYDIQDNCIIIIDKNYNLIDRDSIDFTSGVPIVRNVPESLLSFVADVDKDKFLEFYRSIQNGEVTLGSIDFWHHSKNQGPDAYGRMTYSVVFGQDNRPIKAYGILVDITSEKKLADELQSFKDRFEAAADGAHLALWEYDYDHKIFAFNTGHVDQEYSSLLEQVLNHLPGSFLPYVNEADKATFLSFFAALESGKEERMSIDIGHRLTANKTQKWARCNFIAVKDSDGKMKKAYGTIVDITSQKEEETKYNEFFEKMMISNPKALGIFRFNLTRNRCFEGISFASPSLAIKDQGSVDDFLQSISFSIPFEEDRAHFSEIISRQALLSDFNADNTRISCRYQRRISNGDIHWVESFVNLVENPKTHEIEALFETDDINEQYTEKNILLRISKILFDTLAIINADKKLMSLRKTEENDPQERLGLLLPYDSSIASSFAYGAVKEEVPYCIERSSLKRILTELQSKPMYSFPFTQAGKDGKVSRKLMVYMYLDKMHTRIIMIKTDISASYEADRKHSEELKNALDVAEKANRAKSDFFSNVSHDMRTPLNAIMGFTSLALDSDKKDEQKAYLQKIKDSSLFLKDLINDSLQLSRIEKGKTPLRLASFSWGEMLSKVTEAAKAACEKKKIAFAFEKACYEGYIVSDEAKCEKILSNLLSNAVKFTPEGGKVSLRVISEPDEEGLLSYKIDVKDTGCGMSEDFMKVLFVPFAQEHPDDYENSGTGLGLAVVKRIVELMEGTVTADSKKGEGSEFSVSFKAKVGVKPETIKHPLSLENKTILVCEDNALNMEIVKAILEKKGAIVIPARNGQEGLEDFLTSKLHAISLILMDIRMPFMDGLTATKKIRALDRTDAKTVPIIALSANAFDEDVAKSKDAGMNDHLSKPVEPEEVYEELAKFIK